GRGAGPAGGAAKVVPRAVSEPHREPTQLALGTVTTQYTVPCGDSFPEGAMCTRVTVSCPGLAEADATVAVAEPAGVPISTVILHNGSGGTTVFDNGFPAALLARGVRVVQPLWVTDWPVPAGGTGAAVRP